MLMSADTSDTAQTAAVDRAITSRRSIRAYLPTPVPRQTIEEILAVASRAPSGTNTQPWKVYVLTGAARQRLSASICAAHDDPAQRAQHTEEYAYYPTEWRSPYVDRRRKVGWDLYSLLGIGKADKARMHAQHARARARGLDTCPQAAFTQFHRIISQELNLPPEEMVVCGLALGHADPKAVENTLVTEREPVAGFARFME